MRTNLKNRILGHARTIAPSLRHRIFPFPSPDGDSWRSSYTSDDGREISLRGVTHQHPGTNTRRVVIVHGLGGDSNSAYVVQWAKLLYDAGFDILRLGLRGSDGEGHPYHIGLTDDVEHAILEGVDDYDDQFVVGFSLGGHITLRTSTLGLPIKASAAISPPIDLIPGVEFLDSPSAFVYRRYVLDELLAMWRSLEAAGTKLPTTYERVKRVKFLREWDELTIAPHYGFDSADHYYASNAMVERLDDVVTPTYVLVSPDDPMIPIEFVKPYLETAEAPLTTRYFDGAGHVFFPFSKDPSIAGEVIAFFNRA